MNCGHVNRKLENEIAVHRRLKKRLVAMIPLALAVGVLAGLMVELYR